MGRELPKYPTLFAKFPGTLIGAYDPILLPRVSEQVDWEVELGVVIGRPARHVSGDEAIAAIAGYTVVNDVSVRDYQTHTNQFLAGKIFERTTPVGPALVTLDELPGGGARARWCAPWSRAWGSASTGACRNPRPAELGELLRRLVAQPALQALAVLAVGQVGAEQVADDALGLVRPHA